MWIVNRLFLSIWLFPITYAKMCVAAKAVRRLGGVEGLCGKENDIIFHHSSSEPSSGLVVYFGGDAQDYTENMNAHRDNKRYSKWNLESTCELLHQKFPMCDIYIIRPVRMHLNTFSCYENFVDVNNFGVPNLKPSLDTLNHLRFLLQNAGKKSFIETQCPAKSMDSPQSCDKTEARDSLPISFIGFSRGCVVLNQLLYSFTLLPKETDSELRTFVSRIKCMYWLDGGHSGTNNTWVTDKAILQNFSELKIKTRIHVTPYQVCCSTRPRIGKEEKTFRQTMERFGGDVQRTLHFEDQSQSLETHFQVLESFIP